MTSATLLLIDDEVNTIKVLSAILKKKGYDTLIALSAEDGLERLKDTKVDTIVVDYKLPGMTGVDFIGALKRQKNPPPVVMLTAYGTIENAVEAMRKGAFNYLTKPVNPDELLMVVREAIEKQRLLTENIALKSQLKEVNSFQNIIGKSPVMQDLFSLITTVSKSSSNVLITGESGTGKELVARAIHFESPRSEMPFIPIDCAALPGDIIESEIFGHERGSFTGAYDRKTGQIELAQGGTVFLDEVSEMHLGMQKKFLRFLQEKEIMKVGGNKRVKVDVRVIAASNKDLQEEVKRGTFREDLFYRLNVVALKIPPLRDRREDIPLLASHFLSKYNRSNNKNISSFDKDALEALMEYQWKGNVRELENAVERAVVLCPAETILLSYLPRSIRDSVGQDKVFTGTMNLSETERRLIVGALESASYNQTRAAEILGITRKQLRTKMKNHGLMTPKEEAALREEAD